MGFRFRKSIQIMPGVRLNLGSKSAGISIGNKYGGVSFNSKTGARSRVSIPGTGISYSEKIGSAEASAVPYKPKPLRWWYIGLIVMFFCLGIASAVSGDDGALPGFAIAGIMMFYTVRTWLKSRKGKDPKEE